jgi:hypothetical protein
MSEQIRLKGGHVTTDRRLDRIPSIDPRRFDFPAYSATERRALTLPSVKKSWGFPTKDVLDQGREGACVGFAAAGELFCSPYAHNSISDAYARAVYKKAQTIDEWAGESYEGTSVNAGAKVLKNNGFIGGFNWLFTVEEMANIVVSRCPVVVGTDWFQNTYDPGDDLLLDFTGSYVGGHSYLIRGYAPANVEWVLPDGHRVTYPFPTFRMRNSWSEWFGANGDAFISVDSFSQLLQRGADMCMYWGRKVLSPLPPIS